jgi:hypothetical protein
MSATLPPPTPDRTRLADLLFDPREARDVEIKGSPSQAFQSGF